MQPKLGETVYLKRNINGQDVYQALAYGGNIPAGYSVVPKQEFVTATQRRINELAANPSLQGGSGDWGNLGPLTKNLNDAVANTGVSAPGYNSGDFKDFNPNGDTSESNYTDAKKAEVAKIPSNLGGTGAAKPAPNLGGASNGTSTQPKPFGLENITSTLNLGSQSAQVKELQKWLAGNGYVGADGKPLKEDGIYGPETKTAVMQFQSKNGLTPDGIFGPKSLAKASNIASTSTQIDSAPPGSSAPGSTSNSIDTSNPNDGGTTYNTGDPTQDALLQELQKFIKDQQDAGLKINAALNFDQATIDKFLETAKKQVHPYYQSQIDTIKADVLRSAPQILANYGNDIEKEKASFESNLGTARENYAQSGLTFSGQRAKGELGMLDAQNRDLASLNQTYGNKLYDLGTTAEGKIGSVNTPSLGSLSNYSANLNGNGGFTLGSSNTPYTQGNQVGSLNYDEASAVEARNQALKKTASESVVAGRSYQDLFA